MYLALSWNLQRERDLRHLLIEEGWFAGGCPASKGVVNVLALRAGHTPRSGGAAKDGSRTAAF